MNEENTSGFYKLNEEEDWFMFAPNFVYAPDYTLENKGQYKDGQHVFDKWYYFDNEDNAVIYFEFWEQINDQHNDNTTRNTRI